MSMNTIPPLILGFLKKELRLITQDLPDSIRTMKTPPGIVPDITVENNLFSAPGLKKISFIRQTRSSGVDVTEVLLVPADNYDLPYVTIITGFTSPDAGKLLVKFEAKPVVRDEISQERYIKPFLSWRREMHKLPSEPVARTMQAGETMQKHMSPLNYLRYVPSDKEHSVSSLTDEFLSIYLTVYRTAVPVSDTSRIRLMQEFREEYNRQLLDEGVSLRVLIEAFGEERVKRMFRYLVEA